MVKLPFRQLQGWYQYYLEEPFGWQIEELRHGQMCSSAVNSASLQLKKLVKPSDFYLRPPSQAPQVDKPPSPEEIKQKFHMG